MTALDRAMLFSRPDSLAKLMDCGASFFGEQGTGPIEAGPGQCQTRVA